MTTKGYLNRVLTEITGKNYEKFKAGRQMEMKVCNGCHEKMSLASFAVFEFEEPFGSYVSPVPVLYRSAFCDECSKHIKQGAIYEFAEEFAGHYDRYRDGPFRKVPRLRRGSRRSTGSAVSE